MALHKGSGLGGRIRLWRFRLILNVFKKTYMFEITEVLYNKNWCRKWLRLHMWAHKISKFPWGSMPPDPPTIAHLSPLFALLNPPLTYNLGWPHKWILAKLLTDFSLHTHNMELNSDLQRSIVSLQMKQNPCFCFVPWALHRLKAISSYILVHPPPLPPFLVAICSLANVNPSLQKASYALGYDKRNHYSVINTRSIDHWRKWYW